MTEHIVKCRELVGVTGKTFQFPEYIDLTEEIVRCRDCRHFEFGEVHMFDGRRSDMYMCARMKGCRVATEPDGFCWRGVRRDA